jgi:hypothetical protein
VSPMGEGAYLEVSYADGPEGAVVVHAVAAPPGNDLTWLARSASAFHKVPFFDSRRGAGAPQAQAAVDADQEAETALAPEAANAAETEAAAIPPPVDPDRSAL